MFVTSSGNTQEQTSKVETNSKCMLCNNCTQLKRHIIKEIEVIVKLCPRCSLWLNRYIGFLKSHGYEIEK